ncbi:3947_t:CDS:10 [Diversispora eburnea]|uniref:3947_t:CDS:1 n=1 Tax=Diversispora eburnea TaxID=1213867 RepID=A0A9N8Z1S2_9GLOM|nr:3947_t:CDS:10 [Diversispora eburnea]
MTEIVDKVIETLKGNSLDKKIDVLEKLEEELEEQTPLEPQEISQLTPVLREAIKGSHAAISYAALTCLNKFVLLIAETHPSQYKNVVTTFASVVIDKFGDSKEKSKEIALQVLFTMYNSATSINGGANTITALGQTIKEYAFGHKQWKVREQILHWVLYSTKNIKDFSLRQWVPYMVKLLEDTHESVRETAKDIIVLLFSGAASHAKTDLKRELREQSIRSAIADYILARIFGSNDVESYNDDNLTDSKIEFDKEDRIDDVKEIIRPMSSAESDVGAIHVDSAKELEKEFQNLSINFQGKESEENWLIRERAVNRMRALVRGDAFTYYKESFINGLKITIDGFLTSLMSLRTTLSLASSNLLNDLATNLGPALDPFADNILAALIKMVLSTKKIISRAASNSAHALLEHASYHHRLVTQLWNAMEEQNKQLREHAICFVKTVINSHSNKKDIIERTGGAESLEKCVRKGLTDANPKVRETCREVFWIFYEVWPERGENIEPAVKKQLERDKPKHSNVMSPTRTTIIPLGNRSSVIKPKRPPSISTSDNITGEEINTFSPTMSELRPKTSSPARSKTPTPRQEQLRPKTPSSAPKLRSKSPAPPAMRKSKSAHSTEGQPSNAVPVSVPIQPRKLSVIEQLSHSSPNTRIEGIFNVAQLVVKRTLETPSGKPDFKKALLPTDEEITPHIFKILEDTNIKVLEQFFEPNVFLELAKITKLEYLIPHVILLLTDETKPEQSEVARNFLPRIKKSIGDDKALATLDKCLSLLGNTATAPRKLSTAFNFTPPQRRKIANGILIWLNEAINPKLEEAENNDGLVRGYIGDLDKYQQLAHHIIQMATKTKKVSENYEPLCDFIVSLHKLKPDTFESVLYTYDNRTIDTIGEIVGWEEELKEAEEELLEEQEEQENLARRQQELFEKEELERRTYEENLIKQQQMQLQELQRQKQEQLEKKKREREEREKQLQQEKQLQLEQEYARELQRQEWELEQQRKRELAQREFELQREIQIKRERELQEQRELEREREYQRELQMKHERELQEQRELEYQRELQLKHERELQDQRELEFQRELQMKREREIQMKRERELNEQRELEYQRELRERELQEQRELEYQQEVQKRERELQEQRELEYQRELQIKRERELQEQHERELQEQHELEYQRDLQMKHERELQEQHELEYQRELQMKRERELQEQRELEYKQEAQKRERELQEHRELEYQRELQIKRERELQEQRELEYKQEAQKRELEYQQETQKRELELQDQKSDREQRELDFQRGIQIKREQEQCGLDLKFQNEKEIHDLERHQSELNLKNTEENDWEFYRQKSGRDQNQYEKNYLLRNSNRESDWDERSSLSSPRDRKNFEFRDPKEGIRSSRIIKDSDIDDSNPRIPSRNEYDNYDNRGTQPSARNLWENDWNSGYKRNSSRDSGYKRNLSRDPGYKRSSSRDSGYKRNLSRDPGYKRNSSRDSGYKRNSSRDSGLSNNRSELVSRGRRMSRDSSWTEAMDKETFVEESYDELDHIEPVIPEPITPEAVNYSPVLIDNVEIQENVPNEEIRPDNFDNNPTSQKQLLDAEQSQSQASDQVPNARQRAINHNSQSSQSAQAKKLLLITLLAQLNSHVVDSVLFSALRRLSTDLSLISLNDKKLADDIWENGERFGELMTALIGFLSDKDQQNTELKEHAIILLDRLIENQFEYTSERRLERDILRVLLECRSESSKNVYEYADESLNNYIQRIDMSAALYALIDIMESDIFADMNPKMTISAFVALFRLIKRYNKQSLERQIGRIIPLMVKGFKDQRSIVRKSVIDTFVAIYLILGEDDILFQYLHDLNNVQIKVINYYFAKNKFRLHS